MIKKLLTLTLMIAVVYTPLLFAQQAHWISPTPVGNTLWEVEYLSNGNALTVGAAGTMMTFF